MTIAPPVKTGGDFSEDYERSRKLGLLRQIPFLIEGLQKKIQDLEDQRKIILQEYPEFEDLVNIKEKVERQLNQIKSMCLDCGSTEHMSGDSTCEFHD